MHSRSNWRRREGPRLGAVQWQHRPRIPGDGHRWQGRHERQAAITLDTVVRPRSTSGGHGVQQRHGQDRCCTHCARRCSHCSTGDGGGNAEFDKLDAGTKWWIGAGMRTRTQRRPPQRWRSTASVPHAFGLKRVFPAACVAHPELNACFPPVCARCVLLLVVVSCPTRFLVSQ